MAIDANAFDFLKDLHGRLTDAALRPGHPEYKYYFPLHEGSGDPVAGMATAIQFAPVESLQLFSGFSGSGKTTELFRLKKRLEDAGYIVLYANALEYLNPAEPVDITELIIVLAAAFGEAMAGIPGARALDVSFFERLKNFLINTEVRVSGAGVHSEVRTPLQHVAGGLKAGVDLKLELKTASSFRQHLQRVLNSELTVLQQQAADFYADAIKRIRLEKGPNANVVFIFDQLEQMRGGLLTEQAVINSVERLFTTHLDRLRIQNVHVVYAAPPWLWFVRRGLDAVLLPTLHLWERDADRSPTERNLKAFRAVVQRRLGDDGLRRLFGDDTEKRRHTLDRLATMSGGHIRDLLRLLRLVALGAASDGQLPVPDTLVDSAINRLRQQFAIIAREDARRLAEIGRDRAHGLPSTEPREVSWLSRALDDHSVLFFMDDDAWFDIHPLIRDEVSKLAPPEPAAET